MVYEKQRYVTVLSRTRASSSSKHLHSNRACLRCKWLSPLRNTLAVLVQVVVVGHSIVFWCWWENKSWNLLSWSNSHASNGCDVQPWPQSYYPPHASCRLWLCRRPVYCTHFIVYSGFCQIHTEIVVRYRAIYTRRSFTRDVTFSRVR